ncbi:hypothetical protein B0186_05475 [Canicola haemoglobinophilus]|uniref:Ribulose-phosphate 3-epimerase n=1 Tax=Canicola haemoglobinophilus TaxID=733 RepID=A0A1V4B1D6_9PAST|nr:hypothetical protein [Canicola haemoglobinophilus]OOS00935.1 hypothetical protein B0186_05475 [Canicola haemoglobinophilus]STO55379.1 ribulose-phosphate 3-epimerase [Canicola haemoglobinophilus]STO59681.1 ribulose-phosphate 3-epimerase [Canicola haemoglobinophilus]STO69052.1 ribulose-phosphate 3-epimerase [Canicola haemoglobinophilus]
MVQIRGFSGAQQGEKYPADYMVKRLSELTLLVGKIREDKLINVDGSMSLELATELAKTKNIDWFVSGSALFAEPLDISLHKWESEFLVKNGIINIGVNNKM